MHRWSGLCLPFGSPERVRSTLALDPGPGGLTDPARAAPSRSCIINRATDSPYGSAPLPGGALLLSVRCGSPPRAGRRFGNASTFIAEERGGASRRRSHGDEDDRHVRD
jgi:hypothetical protein